jgi:hypothetical protein
MRSRDPSLWVGTPPPASICSTPAPRHLEIICSPWHAERVVMTQIESRLNPPPRLTADSVIDYLAEKGVVDGVADHHPGFGQSGPVVAVEALPS